MVESIGSDEQLSINVLESEYKNGRDPGKWFLPPNKFPKEKSVNRLDYSSSEFEAFCAIKRGLNREKQEKPKIIVITSPNKLQSAWEQSVQQIYAVGNHDQLIHQLSFEHAPICINSNGCICSNLKNLIEIIRTQAKLKNNCNPVHANIKFPISKPKGDLQNSDQSEDNPIDARRLFETFCKTLNLRNSNNFLFFTIADCVASKIEELSSL